MEKNIKIISGIFLIVFLLALPLVFSGGMFGLAGATSSYYIIIFIGYFGVVASSGISIFYPKLYPAILSSLLLIVVGAVLDTRYWAKENTNLCDEVRKNSTCVEDTCGFNCANFQGGIASVPGSVCKDKDLTTCN